MDFLGSMRPLVYITNGLDQTMKMFESSVMAWILAYVNENKLIAALEAESQDMIVFEAT